MLKVYLKNIVTIVGIISLISCGKGKDDIETPKPEPPVEPVVKLSSLAELANSGELIKDSVWKDSTTHTIYLKAGPGFMLPASSEKKIYPGAIISTNQVLESDRYASGISNLSVVLNFSTSYSSSVVPGYESFVRELASFVEKKQPIFQQANSDNGRPFSTYNDLVLINGYGKLDAKNWLTINNKQTKRKKTGIVFTYKSVDFDASVNLPKGHELIDREKYKSEIAADTLCYVSQIDIGKRAFLTLMCDTTIEVAREVIAKLRRGQELTGGELNMLKNSEMGYYLQGFKKSFLSTGGNETIIKDFFEEIKNSSNTPGVPVGFYLRKIKDLSPYQTSLKIDITRK